MVEVFKTDVKDRRHADMLISRIRQTFSGYRANFDLEDCDKILRIECTTGSVQASLVVRLLKESGYTAEILPDDEPVGEWDSLLVKPFFLSSQ